MTRALRVVVLLFAAACGSSSSGPKGPGGEPCGDVRCGEGYVCIDGSCIPDGACDGRSCGAGQVCSNGRCEPIGTDAGVDAAPPPDSGPDPGQDAGRDSGPEPEPDAGPDPEPDPCEICDPEHHVALANGEPCDCPEVWRVVFAEVFGAPISQVCRDGDWQAYNWNPNDPAACCAGDFSGCSGS